MKKVICVVVVLGVLVSMAACGRADTPSGVSPSVAASSAVSSEAVASAPENNDAASPLFDQTAVKAEFEQVVDACSDVIGGLVIDMNVAAFPMPTLEEYTRMSSAIGSLGLPVDYYDLNMPNYERVETFWQEQQAGKDTQIVIYGLYNWGITGDIFVHKNGETFYTMAVYDFPQSTESGTSEVRFDEPVYQVDDIRMTEKGYLICHIPEQDGWSEVYRGYRVLPLPEENRALMKKYVWGLGYLPDGILKQAWSKDDLSKLNMNWVFDALYYQREKDFATNVYPHIDAENRALIPADVMEGVMLSALPITKAQLQGWFPYDETAKAYTYQAFAGGGYAPTPEVVEVVTNADGSLSLTIDAVAVEFGDDRSMTNILTVMDNPDGSVKYLSNVVMP